MCMTVRYPTFSVFDAFMLVHWFMNQSGFEMDNLCQLLPDETLVELVPDLVWYINTSSSTHDTDPLAPANSLQRFHLKSPSSRQVLDVEGADQPSVIWTVVIVTIMHFLFELAR